MQVTDTSRGFVRGDAGSESEYAASYIESMAPALLSSDGRVAEALSEVGRDSAGLEMLSRGNNAPRLDGRGLPSPRISFVSPNCSILLHAQNENQQKSCHWYAD